MDPVTVSIVLALMGLGCYAAAQGNLDGILQNFSSGGGGDAGPTVSNQPGVFTNSNFGFNLLDIGPSNQGGTYKTDYDDAMLQASTQTGVPWALIKAHCIAESSLVASASRTEPNGRKSYGLAQVLWWPNSSRFSNWGYSDDKIGDGSILYDPYTSCYLGAMIMQDNLKRLGNLDDAINAYNTGVAASVRVAPFGYVDKVKGYYSTLVGQSV